MAGALIERNIQEERKEIYIDRLSYYFKDEHIDNESASTIVKMMGGFKKKLYDAESYYVYNQFIQKSCNKLQEIINTKISHYDEVTRVHLWLPLVELTKKDFFPYCYKDNVSLEDAAALYIMTIPKIINCSFVEEHKDILIDCDLIKEFYFLLELLKKGVEERKLKHEDTILAYRNFLLQYNIVISDIESWLKEEGIIDKTFFQKAIIHEFGLNNDDEDYEFVQESKVHIHNKPDNKNESKRQKKLNNVLKLLYYMAEDKYNHKQGEEANTAKKLSSLSGHSAQTIEGWLVDAAFLTQDDI